MMRPIIVAWIVVSLTALILGIRRLREKEPGPVGLCEVKTFDYLSFLRVVREDRERASKELARLSRDTKDPLRAEKVSFFESKARVLADLQRLVERQVATGGPTYSCVDAGYAVLMYDADFPTLASISREDKYEALFKRLEKENDVTFLKVLEVVLGPAVALLIGLLTLHRVNRQDGAPSTSGSEPPAA